jgi:5'-phosphate synthase pdxT subunit
LLARHVLDGVDGQCGLDILDARVRRNAYGTQLDSFEAEVQVPDLPGGGFHGVFIRAPVIEDPAGATVSATLGGRPVGLRKENVHALTFHPELAGDLRLHHDFVSRTRSPANEPTRQGEIDEQDERRRSGDGDACGSCR